MHRQTRPHEPLSIMLPGLTLAGLLLALSACEGDDGNGDVSGGDTDVVQDVPDDQSGAEEPAPDAIDEVPDEPVDDAPLDGVPDVVEGCEMPDPPATGVAQCQCANDADRAVIENPQIDQDGVAGDCALDHLGDPNFDDVVTECIVAGTGLTEACAGCYTEHQINCSIENCLPACLEPSSEECRDCQREHCDDAFDTCTGATL